MWLVLSTPDSRKKTENISVLLNFGRICFLSIQIMSQAPAEVNICISTPAIFHLLFSRKLFAQFIRKVWIKTCYAMF